MKSSFSLHKIGNQVILRDWLKKDLTLFKKWNQVGHKWQELDGPYYPRTQQKFNDQLEDIQTTIIKDSYSSPKKRLVIAEKDSDLLLGTVGCYWESIETNWLCAGITIYDPTFWGKGIGLEALGLWIEYLFDEHQDIVRLDMRTWSGNLGLVKLANKLGFSQEACFRKARIVNGEYFDSLGFGILKEEFQARYPNGFLDSLQSDS